MADPPGELVVVVLDEPDPDPVVVLVDRPTLGEIAVVAVEGAPDAGRGAVLLDELRDVDAPAGSLGVLERQADRTVRSVSRDELLAPHVTDPEPHPAYDDLPSLSLRFLNRMV